MKYIVTKLLFTYVFYIVNIKIIFYTFSAKSEKLLKFRFLNFLKIVMILYSHNTQQV